MSHLPTQLGGGVEGCIRPLKLISLPPPSLLVSDFPTPLLIKQLNSRYATNLVLVGHLCVCSKSLLYTATMNLSLHKHMSRLLLQLSPLAHCMSPTVHGLCTGEWTQSLPVHCMSPTVHGLCTGEWTQSLPVHCMSPTVHGLCTGEWTQSLPVHYTSQPLYRWENPAVSTSSLHMATRSIWGQVIATKSNPPEITSLRTLRIAHIPTSTHASCELTKLCLHSEQTMALNCPHCQDWKLRTCDQMCMPSRVHCQLKPHRPNHDHLEPNQQESEMMAR